MSDNPVQLNHPDRAPLPEYTGHASPMRTVPPKLEATSPTQAGEVKYQPEELQDLSATLREANGQVYNQRVRAPFQGKQR